MDVGDQARRVLPAGRSEESFGRVEFAGFVAQRADAGMDLRDADSSSSTIEMMAFSALGASGAVAITGDTHDKWAIDDRSTLPRSYEF
jgi:hypothetical protein